MVVASVTQPIVGPPTAAGTLHIPLVASRGDSVWIKLDAATGVETPVSIVVALPQREQPGRLEWFGTTADVLQAVAALVSVALAIVALRLSMQLSRDERRARIAEQAENRFETLVITPLHEALRLFSADALGMLDRYVKYVEKLCASNDSKITELHQAQRAAVKEFSFRLRSTKSTIRTRVQAFEPTDVSLLGATQKALEQLEDDLTTAIAKTGESNQPLPDFLMQLDVASMRIVQAVREGRRRG